MSSVYKKVLKFKFEVKELENLCKESRQNIPFSNFYIIFFKNMILLSIFIIMNKNKSIISNFWKNI